MNCKPPKKVLHITPNGLGNAGVPAVILSIIPYLNVQYDFGCTVYKQKLNRERDFITLGGELHRINILDRSTLFKSVLDRMFRGFTLLYNVYNICKDSKYEIVHCHMGWEAAFCLMGAKLAGVSCRIVHAHNPTIKHRNIIKRSIFGVLRFMMNRLATKCIGCSEQACRTTFTKEYTVIDNGVDLSKFVYNAKGSLRDRLEFIHVGRFDFQKNQEFILDIVAELIHKKQNVHLTLVGFGMDEQMLHQKVHELRLEQSVSFVDGRNVDIAQMFQDADYMIFPSRYEGFGIVLLEAQASGVYCFVSDAVQSVTNVGLWEQISLQDSAASWADKILKRIEKGIDVSKDEVMWNLKRFDVNEIAKQYAAIYNE